MILTHLILFLGAVVSCQCFSERVNNFTTEFLYFTHNETQNGHATVSPYGVWNLLSRISLITAGNTKAQLQSALFLPKDIIELIFGMKDLSYVILNSNSDKPFVSRNYIVVDHKNTLDLTVFKILNIKTITLDLSEKKSAVIVANRIILDDHKKLSVKVPSVIYMNEIDPSGITLANINTFQHVWRYKFTSIREEAFYGGNRQSGSVKMMSQKIDAKFADMPPLKSFVLELPYDVDDEYSMLFMLPYANVKIDEVFQEMTIFSYEKIMNLLRIMPLSRVHVKIPRFKIESSYALNVPLNNMNVFNLFEKDLALFINIADRSLYVPAVVHNVNMVVNENGLLTAELQPANSTFTFFASRPFLYFVIEKTTNTIVVSGVYSKPTIY